MSQYKAYEKYRDSGVEWLGVIPQDWKVSRIKYFSIVNPSKSEIRDLPSYTEVSFFPMEAIGEQGELDTTRTKSLGDVVNGYTYVGENDVCIAKITPCFENGKGAVFTGLCNGIAFATTEVIPMRCHQIDDSKFLYYLLTSAPFNKQAEGSMYGAGGQKRVADSFVANYHFALPPVPNRPHIANFLDHETAKIDALIAKQQELIKLLKEKRQAVISHAVTKGLNPNAPMRDSGVKWLGEVPTHWGITRAKFVSKIFVPQRNKPELNDVNGIAWTTMEDMKKTYISNTKNFVSDDAAKFSGSKILEAGSVIASCVGNFGIASINTVDVIINQQLQAFLPRKIKAEFLREIISISKSYFELIGTAATLVYVNQQGFENLPVIVPPISEQEKICSTILEKSLNFDKLISKCDTAIEFMQERRTALISAAVTGKIDVRDWELTLVPELEGMAA